MKVIILGIIGQVDDADLKAACEKFQEMVDVNVRVNIMDRDDIFPTFTFKQEKVEDSEFIKAIKSILTACGDIRIPDNRAQFYKLVIDKTIERPILEVMALGPKNQKEANALKDVGGKEFYKIIRSALNLTQLI